MDSSRYVEAKRLMALYQSNLVVSSGSGTGTIGPTGPAGPAGAAGPAGPAGPAGSTGGALILGSGNGSIVLNGPTGTNNIYYNDALQLGASGSTAYIQAAGNILPATTLTYSLGSTGQRWKDIFVGPGTINIGGATGPTGATGTAGTIGADLSGIVTFSTNIASQKVYVCPTALTPNVGGSWVIGTTGTYGNANYDIIVQQSLPNNAGPTGPYYSLTTISGIDSNKVHLGSYAGETAQQINTVAIGTEAGSNAQQATAIAIGYQAGADVQGLSSIAVGYQSGWHTQGQNAIAIGSMAGNIEQLEYSVALGNSAGKLYQNQYAVSIGFEAGFMDQSGNTIAIGKQAGYEFQQPNGIAIGELAGETNQSNYAVALGYQAGQSNQGAYAIALGYQAGRIDQSGNSIVLNASNTPLNASAAGFFAAPVRNDISGYIVKYNTTSSEFIYDTTPFSGGGTAFGNTVRVDAVNGNDVAAAANPDTVAFLTIGAAITAATAGGKTVWIFPGTYDETVSIPSGVAVRGVSAKSVIIRPNDLSVSRTAVTMTTNTRLEDVSVLIDNNAAEGATYIGIQLTNSAATTSVLNNCIVQVSAKYGAPATNMTSYGIDIIGSGGNDNWESITNCIVRMIDNYAGSQAGYIYGINNESGSYINVLNTNVYVDANGFTGTAAAAHNLTSGGLTLRNCTLKCNNGDLTQQFYDIMRSDGVLQIDGARLLTYRAGPLGFTMPGANMQQFFGTVGDFAAMTYYLLPGTVPIANLPITSYGIPFTSPRILYYAKFATKDLLNLGNSIIINVYKNTTGTLLFTKTINSSVQFVEQTNAAYMFTPNDTIQIEIQTSAITGNMLFCELAYY